MSVLKSSLRWSLPLLLLASPAAFAQLPGIVSQQLSNGAQSWSLPVQTLVFITTLTLLPAIAERNPDKVGKLTAGSHIPIISEAEMRERKPDYLLVLPWHFIDGFLERERDLIAQGTRLVAPLPTFRVLGG